jgi:hypothetical protein
MDSIRDLAPEIQQRISGMKQFLREGGLSVPITKNVVSLLWSILRERSVQVTVLAQALEEKIAPKKTWERLRRTIGKAGLWKRLLEVHRTANASRIRGMRYCIVDISDVQKRYAQKMEGLSRVRDGNKEDIGDGYWWLNAVMVDNGGISPVYSELYSLEHEAQELVSENTKLLEAMEWVHTVHPEARFVIDRGGDRGKLFKWFLREKVTFIVRGQKTRSVGLHANSDKRTNIMEVAMRVNTTRRYTSRTGKEFRVGLRRIYLNEEALWLVVSRREEEPNALSWFLTNAEGTREEIMDIVMEGYGYRWRVEEYHRQIKHDYTLESMCLREYEALKNLTVLVVIAAAFVMRLPEHLALKLVVAARLLPHNRLSDLPSYPFYMFSKAVAFVLEACRKIPPKALHLRKRDYFQLSLPFLPF